MIQGGLESRFITRGVVTTIGQDRRRRQFVLSTHKANIPVLGDAELIPIFAATGEALEGQARIAPSHMASVDSKPVCELVEEILGGGKAAFEMCPFKFGS